MRILSITAGAAGMYCGSCTRDNALALQRTQRAADIDAELMAALERWELLGG